MEWILGQWFVPPSWPHTLEGVNWDWWSTCLAKLLLMSAFRETIGYCLDVVPGVDFSAASLVLAPRLSSSSVNTRRWRVIPLTMSLQALHPEELVLMTHRTESVGYPNPRTTDLNVSHCPTHFSLWGSFVSGLYTASLGGKEERAGDCFLKGRGSDVQICT